MHALDQPRVHTLRIELDHFVVIPPGRRYVSQRVAPGFTNQEIVVRA
jgi:hypothetical protein